MARTMAVALYIFYFLLAFERTRTTAVLPIIVIPEIHRVNIRSTPSLDPAEEILEKFGSGSNLNFQQVDTLLKNIGLSGANHTVHTGEQTCFSSQYFYGMYSKNDGNVNRTDLIDLCPAVLYQLTKSDCKASENKEEIEQDSHSNEQPKRAWGFGFLFVTIISLASLVGACVVPIMNKPIYKKILMSMVSLAVGVLGGSGIFHLMPSALGFPAEDGSTKYLGKCAMIAVGVYLFFALECSMKLYLKYKSMRKKAMFQVVSVEEEKKCTSNGVQPKTDVITNGHSHAAPVIVNQTDNGYNISDEGLSDYNLIDGTDIISKKPPKRTIATVAWMIIIGDGLHNFIDGLAIGASFSTSVMAGVSTSLAVISEELPHELGDFAILLNSGLTYKEAMVANFLSACCCYLGLVVGLVVGYTTSAVKYIYGVAAGMFLYISLVDMLPEAIEMAYAISGNSTWKSIKMLVVVNTAMLFGFTIMLVLAIYAPGIEI